MVEDVWYIHPNTLTPDQSGPTRAYDISKYLSDNNLNVRVISSSYHYEKYKELKNYSRHKHLLHEIKNGVSFTWIKTYPYKKNNIKRLYNWIDLYFKISRLDKHTKNKPRVIIGSSPNPFAAYAAYKLSRKFNSKFIFEFRDIWPDTLTQAFSMPRYHPFVLLINHIVGKLYNNADQIVSTLPGVIKKF
jgi:hypothetical protein